MMFGRDEGSAQEKKVDMKLKEMMQVRTLVKQLIASIPDYQIRTWCKTNEKDLAGDITLDWMSHKETLTPPEKELVIKNWKDVLQMTTREVTTLVKNYGK